MSPAKPGSPEWAIAERIKEVRLHYKMTQEEFADIIDVSRSHLANIEIHRIEPSLAAIIGVLLIDLRIGGIPFRQIDPTWLLLGPYFEPDMEGKVRHELRARVERGTDPHELDLQADWAQHGRQQG